MMEFILTPLCEKFFLKKHSYCINPGLNNEVQDSPVTDEFSTWCYCNFWKRRRSDFI